MKKSKLIAGVGLVACAAAIFTVINDADKAIDGAGSVVSESVKADSKTGTVSTFTNLEHKFVYDKTEFGTFSEFVIYSLSEQDLAVAKALYRDYSHLNSLKLATDFEIPSESLVGSDLREGHKKFVSTFKQERLKAKEALTIEMADTQEKVEALQVKRGELIENQYEHLNYTGVIKDRLDSKVMNNQTTDEEFRTLQAELAKATAKANSEVGDVDDIKNKLSFIESELQVMSSHLQGWEDDPKGMIDSQAFMNVLEEFKTISNGAFDAFNESFDKLLSNAPRSYLKDDLDNVMKPDTAIFFLTYKDQAGTQFFQLVDGKDLSFDESVSVDLDFSQSTKVENPKYMGVRALANL